MEEVAATYEKRIKGSHVGGHVEVYEGGVA